MGDSRASVRDSALILASVADPSPRHLQILHNGFTDVECWETGSDKSVWMKLEFIFLIICERF